MNKRLNFRLISSRTLSATMVLAWVIVAAFPFIWTFWGSFKLETDFMSRSDWLSTLYGPNTLVLLC